MSARGNKGRGPWAALVLGGLFACSTPTARAQDAPATSPEFTPPPLQHALGDFVTGLPLAVKMKMLCTPKLLKPPFAGQPVDTIKGLAGKIKAEEVDAKHRAEAARYLGTVDCVVYPEARDMLVQTVQEDPSERVRYEAAKALQVMLSRGQDPKTRGREARRYDNCLGCCNEKTLNALAERAYGMDEHCCPIEPSERVREALIVAIEKCQACCNYAWTDGSMEPEQAPGAEETPTTPPAPAAEEPTPQPKQPEAQRNVPSVIGTISHSTAGSSEPRVPPIQALRGYDIVWMKLRQFVPGKPQYTSIHEGRMYQFATAGTKAEFDRFPEGYAPMFAGIDPVELAKTGQKREGIYLREHEDRFYLFVSKENWSEFQKSPEKFDLSNRQSEQ